MPILTPHIIYHLPPTILTYINIDVGKLVAVGVHEAFEEQVIFDWVYVAEAEAVADEGADSTAAGADRDSIAVGEAAEVPHNQEVAGEALGFDYLQLPV